jgi:hypothetical protein
MDKENGEVACGMNTLLLRMCASREIRGGSTWSRYLTADAHVSKIMVQT